MLQTIRVPKNLMFLTDKLPKPFYDEDERNKRNTSNFALVANLNEQKPHRKKAKMGKIEEADEDREKEIKKLKRRNLIEKEQNSLPGIQELETSIIPTRNEAHSHIKQRKKGSKPKNISMDQIKESREIPMINMNEVPPIVAQMIARKQKEMLLKQLLGHSRPVPHSLGSPYVARISKKPPKMKYGSAVLQKVMESIGKSIKGI